MAELARPTLLLVTLALGASAHAQSLGPQLSDPKKCVVIVDDMGDVGFRISDAQVVADAVVTNMRKRVGFDGATYAGVAASAASMKKLLATPEGAGPQDAQLKWFKACEDNAAWRVRARFGTQSKGANKHWITLTCRKKDADPDPKKGAIVEEKRFEAKSFLEARDLLAAAVPTFCAAIAPPAAATLALPIEGATDANGLPNGQSGPPADPPGMKKKEPLKPWTPPPRRD